jgi:phage tail sheath protein FI
MPEYLAPGVYVEEVSFRSKSIEGVSTTTTGFIGPSRFGPIDLAPDIVTSLEELEQIYGDRGQLRYASPDPDEMHNYLWHGARAFFQEGGKRLYVSRVFRNRDGTTYTTPGDDDDAWPATATAYNDGHGRIEVTDGSATMRVRARFPGAAGNLRVAFTFRLGLNILGGAAGAPQLAGSLSHRSVVWIGQAPGASPPSPLAGGQLYVAWWDADNLSWQFRPEGADATGALEQAALTVGSDEVRILGVDVSVAARDGSMARTFEGLELDPLHERNGMRDGVSSVFGTVPASLASQRTLPIVLTVSGLDDGVDLFEVLESRSSTLGAALFDPESSISERTVELLLAGGNDGRRPDAGAYEGTADLTATFKTGLKQFEDIEDISIVAAPGSTYLLESGFDDARAILGLLIIHATKMRYRIAVLDAGDNQSIGQVRALRARYDSKYAALYYPWVRVLDPVTRTEINLPPSGFVTGIYARNDTNRAVYKAPANEEVMLSQGLEMLVNRAQQDILNPEGINCFRFFPGRGYRLWGARTISSDPEWKYVNLRRYFAYVEHSIDRGTQWAVFEPNGEALWANVRRTVEDFLLNEFQSGALLGDKPEKAYFVKCDRSTMTQNDLDNGRLVCLVGIAPLRPAEFVIFRIGQMTASSRQ